MPTPFPIASYCSSRAWGGLEMNVLRFLGWMRGRGWPTFLYARPDSVMFARAHEYGVPARPIVSDTKLSDLAQSKALAKLLAADGVRVMVFHQSHDLTMTVLTKFRRRGLKIIYSQHMHIAGDKKDFIHAFQFRRLDAFVTPVPWLAARVKERTILTDDTIRIIPRGIEVDRFVNKPSREEARYKLELPQNETIIGIIGRLDPKKGQDVLVKALRRVHDADCKPHLLVVGAQTLHEDTGFESSLRKLVADTGLGDFVHFRPHQEQAELAFAAMDIFVLASESETYGMVTIEALASGLPVIGTDAGGTIDLIDHERNGLRFPPSNDAALAAALLEYLHHPDVAARMAAEAQRDAISIYSHERQCDGWEKLLHQLVPAPSASHS